MTSEAFVWVWLPGALDPVPCGVVRETGGGVYTFNYGQSYLGRTDAISLFDMPLRRGLVPLPDTLALNGPLRDALPDAWGQQVILRQLTGQSGWDVDPAEFTPLTYMLASGSDRFGAIDFQASPDDYVPRHDTATIDELAGAALAIEEGRPLPPGLEAALFHGTSVGGARPKATLSSGTDHWIAKFSSSGDRRPVVRHEALALDLARHCGVHTVDSTLTTAAGRDALLVRRFDREKSGARLMTVSALTIVQLDELMGRHASYPDLLDRLLAAGQAPAETPRQLFLRIAVNIALGNTDDHARNHAALWDGHQLSLSPAYDIDPCRSPGWHSNQAMAYGREGQNASNLDELVRCASVYGLSKRAARDEATRVVTTIRERWHDACDLARLTHLERDSLWGKVVLNPGVLEGLGA